jgi:hypothetical protein
MLLKTNEFDLLLGTIFYNSYECFENFEININFLRDLRFLYNFMLSIFNNTDYHSHTLRLLNPCNKKSYMYLEIESYYYKIDEFREVDITFMESNDFFCNLRNLIISQPLIANCILKMILDLSLQNNKFKSKLSLSTKSLIEVQHILNLKEIILEIYIEMILMFISLKDYKTFTFIYNAFLI